MFEPDVNIRSVKSSMLSIKELVDMFTMASDENGTEVQENHLFGNPESPRNNREALGLEFFVPVTTVLAQDQFWKEPPVRNHSPDAAIEENEFYHSDGEASRRKDKSKSNFKKGSARSPLENKSVHWGDNVVCEFERNSILTEQKQLADEPKRKRSSSDSAMLSSKQPQLSIPGDGQPKKKRQKPTANERVCQCALF